MQLKHSQSDSIEYDNYVDNEIGFTFFLHDLADHLWMYPGYREGQGEALKESLESLFINGCDNVILDLPTGVGKSGVNTAIARVVEYLANNKKKVQEHFGVNLDLDRGDAFYTTPQRSLRDQLANDEDLSEYVDMLKARSSYVCGESGEPCDSCPVNKDPEESCLETPGCSYWGAKMTARSSPIAALTFAMLIVDKNMPPETEQGVPLSFRNRDLVIVDEGHGLENQAASLFAGFSASPWSLPAKVYGNAGSKVGWNDDRYEDVEDTLSDVARRAEQFINANEDIPKKSAAVDKCENFLRKLRYAQDEIANDRPWVVNVDQVKNRKGNKTKKIEIKPVYVNDFLDNFVWSRGKKRVISSATIPYRDEIETWCERIGLPGETQLISKTMPFDRENRLIHTNTTTGKMSGDGEEKNWDSAIEQIQQIHSKHKGENGLIHATSYKRCKEAAESLGFNNVIVQNWDRKGGEWVKNDKDSSVVIHDWVNSDKDILLSPSMMEGVDLYEDRCRWQVLLKTPYPYLGDSRVNYLVNENYDWQWYSESTALDLQQSVGRAVRGPEPEEAASYYVIDSKFASVVFDKVDCPDWFTEAVTSDVPDHWNNPQAAPWR